MQNCTITCRLPEQSVLFLDALAEAVDRDRSYLIKQALEEYIASHRWQLEEIDKAIAEADAGEFASDAEVLAAFNQLRA